MELSKIIAALQALDTNPTPAPDTVWQEKYQALATELEYMKTQAQALYDDMETNGFSVGMIEAEGFLRAMTTVLHQVQIYQD